MIFILPAVVFIATIAVVVIWHHTTKQSGNTVAERLKSLTPESPAPAPSPATTNNKSQDSMPTITRLITGRHFSEILLDELEASGLMVRPSEFLGIIAFTMIGLQFLAWLIGGNFLVHLLLLIVGICTPIYFLKSMTSRRQAAFNAQIVDALTMMTSSLRTGFSILRSMQIIAQEMRPPISYEFQRVINEANIGRPMEDALRGVVKRTKSYDFDLVVTAIVTQIQIGGNLAEILEVIVKTLRERSRIRGEVKALTAEGRISGIILVSLPIVMAMILVAANKPYISLLITEPIGQYMIITGVIMQIIGALIIKKMLTIDI